MHVAQCMPALHPLPRLRQLRGTAAAGSNVTVGIGHLKSYERMGIFLLECVAGCACDPLLVDGSLNDRGSQLHLAQLAATQAGALDGAAAGWVRRAGLPGVDGMWLAGLQRFRTRRAPPPRHALQRTAGCG